MTQHYRFRIRRKPTSELWTNDVEFCIAEEPWTVCEADEPLSCGYWSWRVERSCGSSTRTRVATAGRSGRGNLAHDLQAKGALPARGVLSNAPPATDTGQGTRCPPICRARESNEFGIEACRVRQYRSRSNALKLETDSDGGRIRIREGSERTGAASR